MDGAKIPALVVAGARRKIEVVKQVKVIRKGNRMSDPVLELVLKVAIKKVALFNGKLVVKFSRIRKTKSLVPSNLTIGILLTQEWLNAIYVKR